MSADQAERPSGVILAARNMDWMQVVLNGGPPCFHLEPDGRFCGRAERWAGHEANYEVHEFFSFENLLARASRNDTLSAKLEEARGLLERALGPVKYTSFFATLEQRQEADALKKSIENFLSRKGGV